MISGHSSKPGTIKSGGIVFHLYILSQNVLLKSGFCANTDGSDETPCGQNVLKRSLRGFKDIC